MMLDEAIFMSDRIVMMTNGPADGEDLEGSFLLIPRDRASMHQFKNIFRNHALNFFLDLLLGDAVEKGRGAGRNLTALLVQLLSG